MHVHIDALEALKVWALIVLFGLFWRSLASRWSDNKVGQAMAFIY